MKKNTRKIITDNIEKILAYKGWSRAEMARRAKMDQTTFNNLMNDIAFPGSPRLETIEKVSSAIKLPLWILAIPNCPIELLTTETETLINTMDKYMELGESGRQHLYGVAEREAVYEKRSPKKKE